MTLLTPWCGSRESFDQATGSKAEKLGLVFGQKLNTGRRALRPNSSRLHIPNEEWCYRASCLPPASLNRPPLGHAQNGG